MHDIAAHAVQHHAPPTSFIRKHVFSLDHKVIGKQYYALALVAAICGMFLSWLMRIHLGWNNTAIPGLQLLSKTGAPGGVMTPEYYLQLMTMHGTIMVFFVLTTAPFAAFGNFFLPIQVGAEDMPFPRFNMMSFWVTFVAFLVLMSSFIFGDGPTLGGWTQYAPLNAVGSVGGPGQGLGVILWMVSIALFCIGQLLGSLNFITTTLDLRAKGMSLMRLPMTAWAWFITSCMGLTAFSVLMPACILVILDHVAGTSFFVSSNEVINDQLQPHSGGSTLLWQHLFWFFGHPEVYIAIVPGIGIVFPYPDYQHAQADAQPACAHLLHGSPRRPQLHGLWASHVCEWDESLLRAGILFPYPDHHNSGHNRRADLDLQSVWLKVAHHLGIPVCLGFYFHVREWRSKWFLSGSALDRHHAPWDVLRGRSFPHGDGSRGHVRHLCRNLLLVPQDGRTHDE